MTHDRKPAHKPLLDKSYPAGIAAFRRSSLTLFETILVGRGKVKPSPDATDFGRPSRAEVERMIAEAVATVRERHDAEMQSLAEGVQAGFNAIGAALSKAADVIEDHSGHIVDLMTLALAEEVRSGRLNPSRLTPRAGRRRYRRHRRR